MQKRAMPKRLLVINPNTNAPITEAIAAEGRRMLPDVAITAATGRLGFAYIASRASYAIAAHAALDCYAQHADECDAVLLACFGDSGLEALREVSGKPVITLIDAAMLEAVAHGGRVAIVTGGKRVGPMMRECLLLRGMSDMLAGISMVRPTGADIARDPDGATQMLAQACREVAADTGASSVILGGGGLVGMAARVQPHVPVPVICSVRAGFAAMERALNLPHEAAYRDQATPSGLSPELMALFKG